MGTGTERAACEDSQRQGRRCDRLLIWRHHRPGADSRQGNQIQLSGAASDYVRRKADIMTMAVGLIIHGDQAEQILREGHADLIAVGREILNNPNWPMDAALKLGVEGPFRNVPPQFGYWLGTRAKRGFGTQPSTWQTGLDEAGKLTP